MSLEEFKCLECGEFLEGHKKPNRCPMCFSAKIRKLLPENEDEQDARPSKRKKKPRNTL